MNNQLKAKDAVIAAAALDLDEIARGTPEVAERLAEVAAGLNDLVTMTPLPEGEETRV